MDAQGIQIQISSKEVLAPIISAQIVNAIYSALILKKMCGVEISAEVHAETGREIAREWSGICSIIAEQFFQEKKDRE